MLAAVVAVHWMARRSTSLPLSAARSRSRCPRPLREACSSTRSITSATTRTRRHSGSSRKRSSAREGRSQSSGILRGCPCLQLPQRRRWPRYAPFVPRLSRETIERARMEAVDRPSARRASDGVGCQQVGLLLRGCGGRCGLRAVGGHVGTRAAPGLAPKCRGASIVHAKTSARQHAQLDGRYKRQHPALIARPEVHFEGRGARRRLGTA